MKRNLILLCIGIIFVGSGFFVGYLAGNKVLGNEENVQNQPVEVLTQQPQEEYPEPTQTPLPTPEPTYVGVQYKIILQNNALCLYEVNGTQEKQLRSIEVEEDMYPDTDVAELKKGMFVGTLEGGLEILENFSS